MTSYFAKTLERHFQNYCFTHNMYAQHPDLQASLFVLAKNEIDKLIMQFQRAGYPMAELNSYSRLYKSKINRFYFTQVSPVVC